MKSKDDPEIIYLEPYCCVGCFDGRNWCEDDVFECEDGEPAVKYIRADLVEKMKASEGEKE